MYKNDRELDRKQYIFKNLKFHLQELKRLRPQYEFVMIAVQGSQNYNLDIYDDEYKSDIDTVAIVLPPFSNFVNNDKYISETLILDNNEHIDIKDIRQIFDIFLKQNIKYLEIINTDFRIINSKYKTEIMSLLQNSLNLCRSNIEKLITCTYGMQLEKQKALEHPYEGLKDKIEKYGYDGKQLHHIIRLYYFAERFIQGRFDFKYAMDFKDIDRNIYDILIKAKKNKYSLSEARDISNRYVERLTNLRQEIVDEKSEYSHMITEFSDGFMEGILSVIKISIFSKYFEMMFKTEEVTRKKNKEKLLPSSDKVFVTSDLHFGHVNILGFEESRWDLLGISMHDAIKYHIIDNDLNVPSIADPNFKSKWEKIKLDTYKGYIQLHDEMLIKRWNDVIKHDDDLVFILGDFSFRNGKETNAILKQLRGRKILVLGNHDNIFMDKDFDKSLFVEIVNYKEITIDNQKVIMFHFPIQVWNKKHAGAVHLFGHIHSNKTTSHPMKYEIPLSYNVGVDVNGYKPICIKTFLDIAKSEFNLYKDLI